MKKKVLICIVVIILVIAIIFGVRIYRNKRVLDKIETAIADIIEAGNYSFEVNSSVEEMNFIKTVYNNQKSKTERETSIYYVDLETDIIYLVNLADNHYSILSPSELPVENPEIFSNTSPVFTILVNRIHETEDSENSYMQLLLNMNLSTDTIDGVECYKITNNDYTEWISKETLMPVRYTTYYAATDEDMVCNYTFSINTVEESDVTFNDIDNYTEYDQVVDE